VIYRTLGRTGLQVSLAGLGTGGPSLLGQDTHGSADESIRVVRRALDLGVNLFDTAAAYGDTETLLGRALRGVPRHKYVLATKVWPEADDGRPVEPEAVARSCEDSLRRLGVETIDIFQLHGIMPGDYRAVVERYTPVLDRLRQQGKIRFVGITERFFQDPAHAMLALALQDDLWDTVMVKHGLLNFSAEQRILPLAQSADIGVLNMASVRVKLTRPDELRALMRDWKARGLIAADAVPDEDPLGFLAGGPAASVVAAGYKFAAAHPAVSSVLIGTGRVEHLEANVAALLGPPLPPAAEARVRELFGGLAEAV
jgi:aryl-alcohol dehydrogenase-like predicted oxidoreductase